MSAERDRDFWERHWQIWSAIWTGAAAGAFAYMVPENLRELLVWLAVGAYAFVMTGIVAFMIAKAYEALKKSREGT